MDAVPLVDATTTSFNALMVTLALMTLATLPLVVSSLPTTKTVLNATKLEFLSIVLLFKMPTNVKSLLVTLVSKFLPINILTQFANVYLLDLKSVTITTLVL
jgi:hypothetical protein